MGRIGVKLSKEHRRKISLSIKERISPMKGKHLTEEHKRKISLAKTYEPFWDLSNGETKCIQCHDKLNKQGVTK